MSDATWTLAELTERLSKEPPRNRVATMLDGLHISGLSSWRGRYDLDREARSRGFDGWHEAFHLFRPGHDPNGGDRDDVGDAAFDPGRLA